MRSTLLSGFVAIGWGMLITALSSLLVFWLVHLGNVSVNILSTSYCTLFDTNTPKSWTKVLKQPWTYLPTQCWAVYLQIYLLHGHVHIWRSSIPKMLTRSAIDRIPTSLPYPFNEGIHSIWSLQASSRYYRPLWILAWTLCSLVRRAFIRFCLWGNTPSSCAPSNRQRRPFFYYGCQCPCFFSIHRHRG